MQVVHGLWTTAKREGPGLFIWLEDGNLRTKNQLFEPISDFQPGQRARSRVGAGDSLEVHPFAVDPRGLYAHMRQVLQPFIGSNSSALVTWTNLLLPSSADSPLPSPWLKGHATRRRREEVLLTPWRIPGVRLAPDVALKWLMSIKISRRGAELTYGESIRFWKNAANLVFYSLIHGTYQPNLTKIDHQIKALWKMNTTILANQLEALQKHLPPSCEHEWSPDGSRRTRESIVDDFFNTSIDWLVRHVVGHDVLDAMNQLKSTRKRKKQNPLDSLAPPLLKSLYTRQNSFSAARDVQAAFVAMVANWLKQSHTAEARQWHTCFTVIPPEVGDARIEDMDPKARVWRIAYSLQSISDPNEHIWAQEIWENLVPIQGSEGRTLSEMFLRDLGRALQYFPELRASLDQPYPTFVDLTTEEAYHFMTEQALHLQGADFGVVMPPWWKKAGSRRLTTKFEIDSSTFDKKGLLGFDSMIEFSWKAAIGGRTISENAFRKLVRHNMALLPIDGHWVELSQDDLFNAVTFFAERETSGEMTLREAMHLGMKSDELKTALESAEFDYQGTIAQLFANEGENMPEIDQPEKLKGTLRPYQVRGLSWLTFHSKLKFGACLADDMGLGKTIQLLSLLLFEREQKEVSFNSKPTLLVCPMSVVGNWFRECMRFTPNLRAMVHHGSTRHNRYAFMRNFDDYDLIITTYHLVNRDLDIFKSIKWHRVALDEAQNIKNPTAQQSQAVFNLNTEQRIALTGTPVENKLSELWSIMEFLNPGYLGGLKDFQTRFALPIERQGDRKKAELLRRLTQPFILRRLKTDQRIIKDLPDKIEMKVYCDLTEEQAALYQGYVQRQLSEIEGAEGIKRNQLVLTTLMKLKQICNHPAHFMLDGSELDQRSGKLMRLTEMLEEAISEGDNSLIFTQFTKMGELLVKHLTARFNAEVLFMHGGIQQHKRQEMVDRFQNGRGSKIFILTVKTGGTGLNLTAATHVFHYDRWWNPAVENQATDRAFRIGQTRNVQVHKLIAIGTLEDRIDSMIEKKKELAENIIGTDESWLSRLSTDALKDILTLSRDEG
ncbi:MAG: DEAD/DEAH box helicase [Acidobacteriota bacterium]|nr:DEAD/DEAH box helicase [Acidobacteriota bacterium]